MEPIRCFFLSPTDQVRHQLRRYASIPEGTAPCPGPGGRFYHNAMSAPLGVLVIPIPGKGEYEPIAPEVAADHALWPVKCDHCGYVFADTDERQSWTERLMRRSDGGELTTIRDAPPGAMWDAWWMGDSWKGPDGMALVARCPDGHDWCIDSRASNCTMPNDNVHKCWVRHGSAPDITVDKNGHTCAAGAGSIQTPKWHGFLRGGYFVS